MKAFVRITLCIALLMPAVMLAGLTATPAVVAGLTATPAVVAASTDEGTIASVAPEATAANYPPGSYREGEVVVQMHPGDIVGALGELLGRFEFLSGDLANILSQIKELAAGAAASLGPILKLDLKPGEAVLDAISALRASGLVAQVEPNLLFQASVTPNDPYYPPRPVQNYEGQWNLLQTNADHAWNYTTGDPNLVIAVLDTGVDNTNPDLSSRCIGGFNFVAGNTNTMDDNTNVWHGTSIAGIAACSTDNSTLLAGMTWLGKIMPVKVLASDGTGNLVDIINGVLYASNYITNSQNKPVDFINMSIESSVYSGTLQSAVNYAHSAGVFVAAAAGNVPGMIYPGALDNVVSVAATDQNDVRASFSNHNKMVDIAAPGVEIPGPIRGTTTNFSIASGTSEACPEVTGAALLVKALNPGFTNDQIELRLEATAVDLGPPGRDPYYGWGRLDAQAAVLGIGVSITAPAPYSFPASGYVSAQGVSDGSLVSRMDLYVDGDLVDTQWPAPGYEVNVTFYGWDFSSLGEGAHWVKVVASDATGASAGSGTWFYHNEVTPAASNEWYLAEGTTAHGFETWILVGNSNTSAVTLNCTYMTPTGPHNRALATIPANTRYTINVNAEMPDTDVSAYLWTNLPVTAERAMYWGNRAAGHDSIGTNAPSANWYLAEGSTNYGFDTYILVQNPNAGTVSVQLDFMKGDGTTVPFDFPMSGNSRITIRASDIVPNSDISTRVTSSGGNVVAERAMYWNNFGGGHESVGVTAPSATWFLAEGTTAYGFQEYLLIQNPNATTAHATVYFLKPDGDMAMLAATLPANSRTTLDAATQVGATDVSITVMSDIPVVAERSMYWNNRIEGHDSIGTTTPDTTWYLAEGSTWGFEEYVLLANPTDSAAHVTLTFMRNDGVTQNLGATVGGQSRVTVRVNDVMPNAQVSVKVTSSDQPIMVERSMYWNSRRGGTDSIGAR